ncbi:MAG: hypothetical protein IJI25_10570 [Eubacterium sp.]|nr:hypothetical protein [Eubacterium sp.]
MKWFPAFGISFIFVLLFLLQVDCFAAYVPVSADIWIDIQNGGTAVISGEENCPQPQQSKLTLKDGGSDAFHIVFDHVGEFTYSVKIEPDGRDIQYDSTVYDVKIYVTDDNGELRTSLVVYNPENGEKYAPSDTDPGSDQDTQSVRRCRLSFRNMGDHSGEDTSSSSATIPGESEGTTTESSGGQTQEGTTGAQEGTTGSTDTEEGSKKSSKKKSKGTSGRSGSGKDDDSDSDKDNESGHQPKTSDDTRLDWYLFIAILASAGLFMLSIFNYISVDRVIKSKINK